MGRDAVALVLDVCLAQSAAGGVPAGHCRRCTRPACAAGGGGGGAVCGAVLCAAPQGGASGLDFAIWLALCFELPWGLRMASKSCNMAAHGIPQLPLEHRDTRQ